MRRPRLTANLLDDVRSRAWIYAIQSGEFIKIGKTTDPVRRVGQMLLHNPHEMRVLMYRTVSKNNVYSVERRIHELLAEWRYDREWFTAPLAEIRRAAKRAIAEAGSVERVEISLMRTARRAASEALTRGLDAEKEVARAIRVAKQELTNA
jgi:hypothetical protein